MKCNNQSIITKSKSMQRLTSFIATTVFLILNNNNSIFVSGQNNRNNNTVPVSAPTVTQQTIGPSYSEQCLICNTTDMIFANGSQIVTIGNDTTGTGGGITNCSNLYYGGFLALIPIEGCPIAKAAGCNCTKMTTTTSTSDQPSLSPSSIPSTTVQSIIPTNSDKTPPPIPITPVTVPVVVPVSVPVSVQVPIAAPTSSSSSSVSSNRQGSKYTIVVLSLIVFFLFLQ